MNTSKPLGTLPAGLPLAEPEEVGFSSERLARIGPAMRRYIEKRSVPGTVTLVARHGRVVHLEAQGLKDVENNVPYTTDTIFRIASMTKPIAAVALLMLYEEQGFLLDQSIARVLPEFRRPRVWTAGHMHTEPAAREITFRDCLTHTAGFSRAAFESARAPQAGGTLRSARETMEILAKSPLDFHPGTRWDYSAGLHAVGVIVEVLSGQPLDQFMKERIFDPLGMVDTSYLLPKEKIARFGPAYAVDPQTRRTYGLADTVATSASVNGPVVPNGSGGLLSTPADYARFAQMLLNGGVLDGVRLLGRKTVELMTTNHIGDIPVYLSGPGYGFGLGVYVRKDLSGTPLPGSVGTYGWGGAYCTAYFADPKEDLFGLFFTQVRGYDMNADLIIRQDFQKMVYQALVD